MRVAPIALALVLSGAAGAVRAQEPPPEARAAPAPIAPPRPLTPLTASYPDGAAGDARVVVVITVNADGTVRSVAIDEGEEPFAAAALAASSAWRFEPATRAGAPVAAKVRAEIRFSAPAVSVDPEAGAQAQRGSPGVAAVGAAPLAAPPPPIEVTVRGDPPAPGATSMSRAEVRLLPGAFGDPFRAVETMPGVTPIASGVPFFYVRGAPPGNVGYYLDGVRVPLLYHLGLGPSVVHPAIVDKVDLYPGAYPARYGRFAGAIVAGETRDPVPEWHAEGSLRLVDAGAMVQAPFDGGRGTALVAGRYSYSAALLSLLQSTVDVRYWDYQARTTYDLGPRDRVTVFAFGAYDYLGRQPVEATEDEPGRPAEVLFDTTFHRLDLRYEHRFGTKSMVREAVTLGWDRTELGEGRYARDRILGARSDFAHRLSDAAVLRAGLDARLDVNDVDLDRDDSGERGFTSFFESHREVAVGAYADAVVAVTPELEVIPGLRLDLFASDGATALGVDPRLSSRLAVTRWLRIVEAVGLASQPPSFILPGPGFSPGLTGGLQRSLQTSAGVEVDLPEDVTTTATVFRDAFFDMTDALGSTPATGGDLDRSFGQRSLGTSYGLELTLRRRLTRRLGGLVAYTLSRSERTIDAPVLVSLDPVRAVITRLKVPSTYDRTHVLSAAASYDFGRGYRAGARGVFYTGTPKTTFLPRRGLVSGGDRLPPFFRLDARLEKRWTVGKAGWISAVLEVQNATLSKEAMNGDCERGACETEEIGPVTIPSLGLEGGF